MNENTSGCLQSSQTPFLQEPLLQDVGLLGNQMGAESILQGTYENPNLSVFTQSYIHHLKQPKHVPTDHTLKTFDINDHIKGWSKAKKNLLRTTLLILLAL